MQKRRRTRKLATLYKYGFIGLSLVVLAFIGLVAVQDAPTMTEKLKTALLLELEALGGS